MDTEQLNRKGHDNSSAKKYHKRNGKIKVFRTRQKRSAVEEVEIDTLVKKYDTIDAGKLHLFSDLPLSEKTQKGLKDNKYVEMTEIQRDSIGLALRGLDILGAAKTGSGKTLAFLIPVLEILYTKRWTVLDGVGALIITPTRELAYQIFETLRKVGSHHDFSAGLIIGGKDLKFERKRMDHCNIVICTPGRLLQHMDDNPLFDCINMQILVLDEADRCLDMGFEETMNSIIDNLPPDRQTLLFSATQTKSVRDLARLSLKDPQYVSVHEHAKYPTPKKLVQSCIVCELHEKITVLWSFIKNHKRQKILVFMSSCKQVKYTFEMFRRLKPGINLMALYGGLHQLRRISIYDAYCKKEHAVLFATDIASRGLDFPAVNWVVQMDCPEDVDTYIHRVGRTARYQSGGESLLVLLPSEEKAMIKQLEDRKIPISQIEVNPQKLQSPQRKMEAVLARDQELHATAKRAFVSYVKSVFLMKNKEVFNVNALDTDAYASSLGLVVPPRIRFLQRHQKQNTMKLNKVQKNVLSKIPSASEEEESSEIEHSAKTGERRASPDSKEAFTYEQDDSESDTDVLKIKRKDHELDQEVESISTEKKKKKVLTKLAVAKKILKKKIQPNMKITFNEDGEPVRQNVKVSELGKQYEEAGESGLNIEKAKQVLQEEDKYDKELFRKRVKAVHREKKTKLKKQKKKDKSKEEFEESAEEFENSAEDDDDGPDLSWLPDPDKVYGEVDEQQEETVEESESSDAERRSKKRKSKDKSATGRKKNKLEESEEKEPLDTGLSLAEEEELAMHLLSSAKR